jgi:hypothetical protein
VASRARARCRNDFNRMDIDMIFGNFAFACARVMAAAQARGSIGKPRMAGRAPGFFLAVPMLLAAQATFASCGSAYCTLNTNWDTQGLPSDPGTIRFDLRYEFINQNRLRSNKSPLSPENDTSDTLEQRTANRNLLASLDYTVSKDWAVSVAAPFVRRTHDHVSDPANNPAFETWRFSKSGDARVLGYRRFADAEDPFISYGLIVGVKLPTGTFRVRNNDAVLAERSLQPGTGSTDLVWGGYYTRPGFQDDSNWFAQALLQRATRIKDEFRPGDQVSLNTGYHLPFAGSLSGLLQLNGIYRKRDDGVNAERELSGSRSWFLSPGLSYVLTPKTQLYGFVQLPVFRQVNGVQLSAERSFVAGMSVRF